jgi:hypothetical protein
MSFGGKTRLVRQKRLKEPTRLVEEKVARPRPNLTPAEYRALLEAERLGAPEPLEQPKGLAEPEPAKVPHRGPGGRPGFGGPQSVEAIKAGQARARASGKHMGRPRKST